MHRLFKHLAVVAVAVLLPLAASASGERFEYVTTVEGISEYRLDNGMRVLLMPDASRSTTTINVTYFVGSKHEGYGETGMAHLLEHMLFYGTPDHQDIKAEISERGGVANGTTWYERTNYFQTLPAGEENLEWAIRMEADRMVNSLIDEDDLASEMTVVRNEFEIGENNPFRILMQRVMAAAYEWHGYGRSTIGARSDIENVPIERLQDFYRKYYQPDNAIIILSGNFETERALELIGTHFGAIPAPERAGDMTLWPSYTREPVQDGERTVTVRRSGNVRLQMMGYHVPPASHEDFAAVQVLSHLLGDMPSGRLYKALVDSELASQVGAFSWTLPEPSLLLLFSRSSAEEDLDEVQQAMLSAVDELEDSPPSEAEVRRAINALTRQIETTLNDSGRVGIQLSEWAATGDWRLLFLHRDRLEEVSVDDVIRVASTYLRRDNRVLGQFIPDSDPKRADIPDAPDLEALLADYTGREDRAVGEAFDPTPENIENRLVRFELANGTRVALLPKSTRGNRVQGRISMRMGTLESLSDLGNIPGTTSSMLWRGTENRSRQDIRDELDELQTNLNLSGDNAVTARIESRRDKLEGVLELLEDMFKQPVFPERELAEITRQRLDALDEQRDEPGAVASRQLSRHFNTHPPEHPNYTPDFDESEDRIRAVSRDDLVDFHASHYGFGPGTTISFVGDFDADELRQLLEDRFGDWTAAVPFERIAEAHVDVEPGQLHAQLDDKASAVFIAQMTFPMNDEHPDYPAIRLAGHLMGGGFLSSRLANRVRDDEGLSYAVGGGFNAHSIDERGSFQAFAMYAPENRDRLVEVMFEEFNKVIEEGFEAEEFEAGRRGWLQQMDIRRSDDGNLAGTLSSNLYLDRDMHHEADFEDRVRSLTVEDVNEAVRRHFDPSRISYATAGDFESDD
ncbi:insulinase family protein [Wenzhouxiangella sp. AB-CW3]|uniref:M16 family metallopeptidase n=1 Tax=Wenzhouxiangella sp. AB-CW3 TaxID=2771012 RepID=UPI00168B223E|nr:pitrilysin family protein [Wenzhouxiangella sp. AB-CW3]QOC23085.1 insulinase family protein [Wenzhouxiangella sp. AB-CW3]